MARNRRGSYIEAARTVLEDIGGGPIRSRDLVEEVIKRGLLQPNQFTYFNLLKRVRESEIFDTSKRGFVSLQEAVDEPAPVTETPKFADLEPGTNFDVVAEEFVEPSEDALAAEPGTETI